MHTEPKTNGRSSGCPSRPVQRTASIPSSCLQERGCLVSNATPQLSLFLSTYRKVSSTNRFFSSRVTTSPPIPKPLILYILCTTHTTPIIPCISPCNLSVKYPSPQKISVQLRPPPGFSPAFPSGKDNGHGPPKILLWRKLRIRQQSTLSTEHLDDPIAACADDPSAILAPDDAADTLAAHDAVACDFLCTGAFFEGPEAQAGIVAG
jgi:hypothetical protein